MTVYLLFLIATDPFFKRSDQPADEVTFSSRLHRAQSYESWAKRMANESFKTEYDLRRTKFAGALKWVRDHAKHYFLNSDFLLAIAPLITHEQLRGSTVILSRILALRGHERECWLKLTSYLTLVQAPPDHLDLRKLGLSPGQLAESQMTFRLRGYTPEELAQAQSEFRNQPWEAFKDSFYYLSALWTGSAEVVPFPAHKTPRAALDTFSFVTEGKLRALIEHGAAKEFERKLSVSEELPESLRRNLRDVALGPPLSSAPMKKGRPTTIRLAWMRQARRVDHCGFEELHHFYQYDKLDEEKRRVLDEEIRRAFYKKSPKNK